MDQDLMQYDIIWASAGTPNSLYPTDPKTLMQITIAEIISIH
jgi:prolyl-tRNA editing enzyme YbaK/EbsC (Cys-tRNA(Pro) deacylase)